MLHAGDDFFIGQAAEAPGKMRDLMTAACEFLAEGEPDFLGRAAAQGRDGQEGALDDGDLHGKLVRRVGSLTHCL